MEAIRVFTLVLEDSPPRVISGRLGVAVLSMLRVSFTLYLHLANILHHSPVILALLFLNFFIGLCYELASFLYLHLTNILIPYSYYCSSSFNLVQGIFFFPQSSFSRKGYRASPAHYLYDLDFLFD